jgi:4-amino-4-deoxy-L-arabinose transferase-like glycosyltransferase
MIASFPGNVALPGEARAVPRNARLLLLTSLLAFAAFLTPFVFRAADDNRLTSWNWIFADASVARFAPPVLLGIGLAYALRRIAWPPRHASAWLAACAFAAGATFWSEPEVIVDAARYFTQSEYLAVHGIGAFAAAWGGEIAAWTDLPLVGFLYGLILRFAGEERAYIQAFTTLLFAATVVLTYRIGAELWDADLGFTAAALLFGMPYLLAQVPLMLADVPAMFFVALAVFTTIKALKAADPRWSAAAGAAILLALLVKYSAALFLTVLVPIFVLNRPRERMKAARAALVLFGPALLAGLLLFRANPEVALAQLDLLWSYQGPGLGRWSESLASTFLFQMHPFIAAAAAYSIHAAIRRKDATYVIIAWLPALALLAGIGRARYLVPVFPMLALAAAYGLRGIRDGEARAFAVCCAVFCSLALAWSAYLPFLRSTSAANLASAGSYLDGVDVERVEVIALEQPRAGLDPAVTVPLLDLFTHKPLVYRADLVAVARPPNAALSPLRFTWEFALPRTYASPARQDGAPHAVVVILSDASQALPPRVARHLERHCASAEFMASEGVFGYQTLVRIYRPLSPGQQRCPKRGAR